MGPRIRLRQRQDPLRCLRGARHQGIPRHPQGDVPRGGACRAGHGRARAGAAFCDEIVLGRRARPAAVHADLVPQACGRISTAKGSPDIWNSEADTLASIASYLADYGWVKGRDWGFEVTVPDNVSCALKGRTAAGRSPTGPRSAFRGSAASRFPQHEAKAEGYLLMPAGRNGPAFIVTPNFYVLKEYNESDLYALFIGHGADRIAYGDKQLFRQMGQGRTRSTDPTSPPCSAGWRSWLRCRRRRRPAGLQDAGVRSATGRPRTAAPRPAFRTRRSSRR